MRRRVTGLATRSILAALVATGGMVLPGLAMAQTVIIDTGAGSAVGGLSLTGDQFLAGQFTLSEPASVTDLEGWIIYPTLIGDLPVDAVLYGDAGGVPDLTDEIRSQQFLVPASGVPLSADWHGIHNVVIPLGAGTYWLAFEPPTDEFGSGAMPPTPAQALDLYAIDSGAGYVANTTARIGIRVLPEPATGITLLSGGSLLAALTQRKRSGSRRRPRIRPRPR